MNATPGCWQRTQTPQPTSWLCRRLREPSSALVMAYKRLKEHTFTWPAVKDGLMLMNHAQFEAQFDHPC